jgi:hypothetical protein
MLNKPGSDPWSFVMTEPALKISTALFLVTTLFTFLGQTAASAASATASGPAALAVAAVVAQYSPLLGAHERRVIAGLFDGNAKAGGKGKVSVTAETVTCRISNVAITERSCQITFKKSKRSLKGREANEVYATLASAGVTAQGAAGSMIETISKLNCALDLAEIRDNSGGGASCSFAADQ